MQVFSHCGWHCLRCLPLPSFHTHPACRWFIMDDIAAGRYNGGFAMAKKVSVHK